MARPGLRVERLSGEYTVDVERAREADLRVATTEKFESICRASTSSIRTRRSFSLNRSVIRHPGHAPNATPRAE